MKELLTTPLDQLLASFTFGDVVKVYICYVVISIVASFLIGIAKAMINGVDPPVATKHDVRVLEEALEAHQRSINALRNEIRNRGL